MAKHKNPKRITLEHLAEDGLLGKTKIADELGNVYVFRLWAAVGRPHYMIQVGIKGISGSHDGPSFGVDLHSLQELTAWFAQNVMAVEKYENSLPRDSDG